MIVALSGCKMPWIIGGRIKDFKIQGLKTLAVLIKKNTYSLFLRGVYWI